MPATSVKSTQQGKKALKKTNNSPLAAELLSQKGTLSSYHAVAQSKFLNQTTTTYQGIQLGEQNEFEFGGAIGVTALMIWSHYILFYFWYCYELNDGKMVLPMSLSDLKTHGEQFIDLLATKGSPSLKVWVTYFSFFVIQLLLAAFMPGKTMEGLPTASGKKLIYHCNGYLSYYFCLFGAIFAHYFGIFKLSFLVDHFGEYLIASMVIGNVTSAWWYVYGILTASATDTRTHSIPYDFFMGTCLYPRIGEVDIKMIAEVRWSWLTLMLLTASCAVKQFETSGRVSREMGVMLLAHWLYSNATVKGEHYIPGTWDMFHEKFGWMLNFWSVPV